MGGKILGWVKANLLIVISGVLILVLPAVGWFFSSSWNASVKGQVEGEFNKVKRDLSSKSSVTYSLPAVLEGEEGLSETRAPNSAVTRFYERQREERERQVELVVERGEAFNKSDHVQRLRRFMPEIDDLLPEPENPRDLNRLGRRLGELVAGTNEEPSIYVRVLRSLNAGDAPDPALLAQRLDQYKQQQEQTLAASSPDGRLSPEQSEQIAAELVNRRLGEYASRAESLTFYAALRAIQSETPPPGYSHVPATPPSLASINMGRVFTWVWDSWVITDVLRGVERANTDASGVTLSVPDAPVKHVELIRVNDAGLASLEASAVPDDVFGSSGGRQDTRGRNTRGRGSDDDIPADPGAAVSFTGRTGGVAGSPYDIRTVTLTVVADPQRLPALIDALGKTNYMTVIDVDMHEIDVWDAVQRGYYYGDDHVVRATLTIESVWLRTWTSEFMPDVVKQQLGVPVEGGSEG